MVNVEAQWHAESKGRKPMYRKALLLDMILQHASGGYNQTQIAQAMGVHPNTFTKWKTRYPEIDEILTEGRELLIGRVECALVKRALGYRTVMEKHSVSFYGCEKEGRKPRRVERNHTVEKEVAPDLAAIRTLLTYLGKKLEKTKTEEQEDRIAYFLQGLRENDSHGSEESRPSSVVRRTGGAMDGNEADDAHGCVSSAGAMDGNEADDPHGCVSAAGVKDCTEANEAGDSKHARLDKPIRNTRSSIACNDEIANKPGKNYPKYP
jgi:transposase-like protein